MNRSGKFPGTVRDGKFQIIPAHNNLSFRLTKIGFQEAAFPESAEVNLKGYEDKALLIEGNICGGWIYSTKIIPESCTIKKQTIRVTLLK